MESDLSIQQQRFIKHLPLMITGTLLLTGFVVYQTTPAFSQFLRDAWTILTSNDRPRITAWVNQFGFWGPVILVAAMIVQIFLVVIPSWGLMVVAVLAYGPVWGAVLSLCATVIAAMVAYVAGKYVGDVVIRSFVGDATEEKVERWINRNGFWAVTLARVSPFISGDAVSLISGLTRLPFLYFITATVLGVTPLVLAVAYLSRDTDTLKQGFIWLTAGSIILLTAYFLVKRIRRSPK